VTVSMDGLRRVMAADFNELVRRLRPLLEDKTDFETKAVIETLMELRSDIGGLLACYDPREQPKDWNMLADEIDLEEIEE